MANNNLGFMAMQDYVNRLIEKEREKQATDDMLKMYGTANSNASLNGFEPAGESITLNGGNTLAGVGNAQNTPSDIANGQVGNTVASVGGGGKSIYDRIMNDPEFYNAAIMQAKKDYDTALANNDQLGMARAHGVAEGFRNWGKDNVADYLKTNDTSYDDALAMMNGKMKYNNGETPTNYVTPDGYDFSPSAVAGYGQQNTDLTNGFTTIGQQATDSSKKKVPLWQTHLQWGNYKN